MLLGYSNKIIKFPIPHPQFVLFLFKIGPSLLKTPLYRLNSENKTLFRSKIVKICWFRNAQHLLLHGSLRQLYAQCGRTPNCGEVRKWSMWTVESGTSHARCYLTAGELVPKYLGVNPACNLSLLTFKPEKSYALRCWLSLFKWLFHLTLLSQMIWGLMITIRGFGDLKLSM